MKEEVVEYFSLLVLEEATVCEKGKAKKKKKKKISVKKVWACMG